MIWLIALVLLAQFADYWTTKRGLALGYREANPAARWIINTLGIEVFAALKVIAGWFFVYVTWPLVWPGVLVAVAFFGAAIWNYTRPSKARRHAKSGSDNAA